MTAPLTLTPTLVDCRPDLMTVEGFDKSIGDFAGDLLTAATITRSVEQASTLSLTFEDPNRQLVNSPMLNQAVTISAGTYPDIRFTLVQVQKSKNSITAGFEDAIVNRLRGVTGALSVPANTISRTAFVSNICYDLGIPFKGMPPTVEQNSLVALTRGTAQAPDEDTWTCFTRLASDVGYRCFSDGTTIWFAPDDWLMAYHYPIGLSEFSDVVDFIDYDYDVGKPVSTATIYTYAQLWTVPLGQGVYFYNCPAASLASYLVTEIDRDLFHTPVTVKAVAPTAPLPEPTDDSTAS